MTRPLLLVAADNHWHITQARIAVWLLAAALLALSTYLMRRH